MGHRWRDTDRSPTATASPTCTTNCSATSATCRRQSPFSTRWSRHGPHGSSSWRWEPAGWRSPSPALGHHVTGIDVSAAMLARLRSADGGQRVAAVLGDMVDDLPAGPFDVVFVAFNSLFMLTDPVRQQACFAAVATCLAPGGAFVVEAFVPWDPPRAGSHVEVRSMTTDRVVLVDQPHRSGDAGGQRTVRRTCRRRAGAPPTVLASILATQRARRLGDRRRAAPRRALRRRRAFPVHRRLAVPCDRVSEALTLRSTHTAGFRCTSLVPRLVVS